MTITYKLSSNQKAIIEHAINHTAGFIQWFPPNINGGARQAVLDSLFKRALITRDGESWCVVAEGYDALSVPRPAPFGVSSTSETKPAHAAEQGETAPINSGAAGALLDELTVKPHTRDGSKQAQVIALLQRSEGATIAQICEVTSWQSHTVRGTFAGAFKKRLGLKITSTKVESGDRVYRIE